MLKKYSNKKLNLRKETQKKKNTKRSFKKKKLKIRQKIQKSKKKTTKIGGFDEPTEAIRGLKEVTYKMPLVDFANINTDSSSDEDKENMGKQILETDGDSLEDLGTDDDSSEDCKNYLDTEGEDKKCFDENEIKQCLYRKKERFMRDIFFIKNTLKEKGYNEECKVNVENIETALELITSLDLTQSENCIPFKKIMNLLSSYTKKKKKDRKKKDILWLKKNMDLIITILQSRDYTSDCKQETTKLWNKINELFVTEK